MAQPKLPPVPEPPGSFRVGTDNLVDRLRTCILWEMTQTDRGLDRQRFAECLDYLDRSTVELPTFRHDGRGTDHSRASIVYAAILYVIRLLRAKSTDNKLLLDIVKFCERAQSEPGWRIVGDIALGYTLTWESVRA